MTIAPASSTGRRGVKRVAFYGWIALGFQAFILADWAIRHYVLRDKVVPMVGIDFGIFWAAARVTLAHGAVAVFSAQWMQPIEASVRSLSSYAPLPYPPTFLLVILPFGLLPFGAAFALFEAIGLTAYGAAIAFLSRNIDRSTIVAIAAFPGIALAIFAGQNSLLTVAAAGGALVLIESNPLLAGACVAVLAIKPQFGILFPLALLCGRQWKMLTASAVCSIGFVGVSAAVLGIRAWAAFAAYLPEFNRIALLQGSDHWLGMPTIFAIARLAGWSVNTAYAAHTLVALPAALVMAYLWWVDARFDLRAAALVIATLLVLPYVMNYDLAWLVLPIVFLIRDSKVLRLSPWERAMIGAAWLIPFESALSAVLRMPYQLAPAVLIVLMGMVVRRHILDQSDQVTPYMSGAVY